jgi:peptide/nickel transport system substrate-binding protein
VWAIVVIALTFGACTKEQAEAPPSGGTLVVGITSEPGTLNPLVATAIQEHDIINMMFSKLLVEEADFLNFRPGLAERWSFSADSLSITFHLREGMVWQDGVPITAADVRFTWQLQTDTLIAWASRHLKDGIRDVDVVDDHTVVFHYGNRYPYQLKDANDGVILPRHVVENIPRETFHTSPFGRDPVGNGPFRLATWAPGQYIELDS